jgi:hypothetical protein
MKINLILLAAVLSLFVPDVSRGDLESPIHLSLVQLIAIPERFDGKLVSVTGFLHVDRELAVLFLGENDRNHAILENAITFHLNEQMGKDTKKLNENYVGLIGVFHAPRPGRYPCPNGEIDPVQRYWVSSLLTNPAGHLLDQSQPKKQ